jgi:hypothetical protein
MAIDTSKCKGVVISGSASYGNDPVPLYEAGKSKIACVLEIEALGQIQVSNVVTDGLIQEGNTTSFGGVTLTNTVNKYSITAQSGQAYYVNTVIVTGQHGGL